MRGRSGSARSKGRNPSECATAAPADSSAQEIHKAPSSGQSGAILSLATKTVRRNTKRGWGPFRSVVKERSAEFNLTLDVNNLRQEIQHLTSLRDLHRSKLLIQRHSHEGSLAKLVHEFFRVFRHGIPQKFCSPEYASDSKSTNASSSKISESSQLQFLHSMMDPHIDFGSTERGHRALADHIKQLSTTLRNLRLCLIGLDVFIVEELVVVAARVSLHFRIAQETIDAQFPLRGQHQSSLVRRLLGRQVEAGGRISFYFDTSDKCVQLVCDVDFVSAFNSILSDLAGLASLISGDSFDSPSQDEPPQIDPGEQLGIHDLHQAAQAPGYPRTPRDAVANVHPSRLVLSPRDESNTPSPAEFDTITKVIHQYFDTFQRALASTAHSQPSPRGVSCFMDQLLTPDMRYGHHFAGRGALEERWCALSENFDILAFRLASLSARYRHQGLPVVTTEAVYSLRLKASNIARIFPRLGWPEHAGLRDYLLSRTLTVRATLTFVVRAGRCGVRIARLDERMNFLESLQTLLPNPFDLETVLADTSLTDSGED